MTESTRELFNNFKGTLTNYTSNAFGIGMHMSAYKTTPKETKEQYKTTIRSNIKDVAIRTTFIVGYPGETEEEFNDLYNFVKDMKFLITDTRALDIRS